MAPDHFEVLEESIDKYVAPSDREASKKALQEQKKFLEWKIGMKRAFYEVQERIKEKNIKIYEYYQLFPLFGIERKVIWSNRILQ